MGKDKSYKQNKQREVEKSGKQKKLRQQIQTEVENTPLWKEYNSTEGCCFALNIHEIQNPGGLFGHIPRKIFEFFPKKPELNCQSVLLSTDGSYEWIQNQVNYDVLPSAEKYKALEIFGLKALHSLMDEVALRFTPKKTRPTLDEKDYVEFDAPNTIGPCLLSAHNLLYDDDISFGLQRLQGVNVGHSRMLSNGKMQCSVYGLPSSVYSPSMNRSVVNLRCTIECNQDQKWVPTEIDYGYGTIKKKDVNDWQWRYAKLIYQVAEFQDHEIIQHLKSTHLVTEVFIMETMRTFRYEPQNLIYRLLVPHFQRTLAVNHEAQLLLLPWIKTHLTNFSSDQIDSMLQVQDFDVKTLFFDSYLVERGFDSKNLPQDYYYAKDGLEIWNILLDFVTRIFSTNLSVNLPSNINTWCTNIQSKISSFPTISNVIELAKVVTAIIFNAAVLHSCLNDPQYYFHGFVPNMPAKINQPILSPFTQFNQEQWKQYYLNSLPDKEVMNLQRDLVSILSLNEPANSSFLTCTQEYRDFVPCELVNELQLHLSNVACAKRSIYPWMNPFQVTRSVIR